MDVGWDITSKDVERLRQFITPTILTLPNLEPIVQPYIPLGPVHDKDKFVREKEQDYDIPLNDSVMQPLTPQTVHITPPDDNYVALATNPMSNKQINKFKEEFSHITEVAKKEYDNLVIKTYDYETFIWKLLHQVSQSSREMNFQQQIQQLGGIYRDRLDSKSCGNFVESAVVGLNIMLNMDMDQKSFHSSRILFLASVLIEITKCKKNHLNYTIGTAMQASDQPNEGPKTLQDFGTMSIFKRTFSQDLDLLEQHLTKETISQTDCKTIFTKLRTKFENAFNSKFKARTQKYTRFDAQSLYDAMIFNMDSIGKYQQRTPQLLKQKKLIQTQEDHSNPIPALNVDSLKVDLVVIQNTYSEKEDSNSKTASNKLVKESSLNSETKDVHAIKYKMSKAKERCMAYFRSLHSHLQVLSKEDLKGTRIEHGFKRAFMSLFGQDADTFTSTMLLNVDQLQKQLDKDEFQEDGSMAAFWVVNNQFQKFIDS
ncbi:hypothetical protein Tco_0345745 [Tanacetum coccineum]